MGDARSAALDWARRITKDYKGVKIDDLLKSFQDGLAFCAIIHYHLPESEKHRIPFDTLRVVTQEDKEKNLRLAFDVAIEVYNIPEIIEVEDVGFEQLSMITAINHYRQHLSKKIPKQPEPAANTSPVTKVSSQDSLELSQESKLLNEKLKQREQEHDNLLVKLKQSEDQHRLSMQKLRESEEKHKEILKGLQERDRKDKEITDMIKTKDREHESAITKLREKEIKQQELVKQLTAQEAKQEAIIDRIRKQEKFIADQDIKLSKSGIESSAQDITKQLTELSNRLSELEARKHEITELKPQEHKKLEHFDNNEIQENKKQLAELSNRLSSLDKAHKHELQEIKTQLEATDLKKHIATIENTYNQIQELKKKFNDGDTTLPHKKPERGGNTALLFFTSFITLILLAHSVYQFLNQRS